jgi:FkbM family methyltransferase
VPVELGTVRNVLDLGANIGLTSVYLARKHESPRILAVEPVASNAELTRSNLAANGIDADVVEAAVAPFDGTIRFQESVHSNVGHVSADGRPVAAVSMPALLQRLGDGGDVDLLKIDIEGAEGELLSESSSWLDRVRCVIIEFHPDHVDYPGLVALLKARGFDFIPRGSVFRYSTDTFVRR